MSHHAWPIPSHLQSSGALLLPPTLAAAPAPATRRRLTEALEPGSRRLVGSGAPSTPAVDETAAEEVARLVVRERQSRDRGWWEEWADCFAEGSLIDLSWFVGSGARFVEATRRMSEAGGWGGYSRHRLSPPAIRIQGSRALAEVPVAAEFRIHISGTEADLTSYCRSQYRAQEAGGCWRITRLTSIYERDTLEPSVPGTRLDLNPDDFAAYRPSYRCLAWYLRQRDIRVPADLPGDDQAEAAAKLYEAEAAWLGDESAGES